MRSSLGKRKHDETVLAQDPLNSQQDSCSPGSKRQRLENASRKSTFCTIKNTNFYSTSAYSDLDASKHEIRLLKILPDSGSGPVECELLPKRRLADVEEKYTALSYVAGDPKNIEVILVDGVRCNVFANLDYALREARNFWSQNHKDEEFLLWVDQICIDQSNDSERSHQVGFMREIYQSAKQTLASLSADDRNWDGEGLAWFQELYEHLPLELDPYRPTNMRDVLVLFTQNPQDAINFTFRQHRREESGYFHALEYLKDNIRKSSFVTGWVAFRDLLLSPWWSRAWIFQEFISSTVVYFLNGRQSVCWNNSSKTWFMLCIIHNQLIKHEKDQQDSVLNKLATTILEQSHRVRERFSSAEFDEKTRFEPVQFVIASRMSWAGSVDLVTLLKYAQSCHASDSRDKIFALLGLSNPGYDIVPSYEKSIREILIETTKRIMTFEDSLDVLAYVRPSRLHSSSSLPSWVVDWVSRWESLELPSSLVYRPFSKFKKENSSFSFLMGSGGQGPTFLQVWGARIDYMFLFEMEKRWRNKSSQSSDPTVEMWMLEGASFPLALRPIGDGYLIDGDYVAERDWQAPGLLYEVPDSGIKDCMVWKRIFLV
ncbi:MAG: hypothetical protein M1820_002691 [Bogoriella megaspora]|nr:MAG: hypothetical protein M1820_002691 [Bogoriella megaspora]